jgi:hypothetical protein
MNQEPISFECYCVEILNIPYYNFLSMDEWENCHKKYEEYLEKLYEENMMTTEIDYLAIYKKHRREQFIAKIEFEEDGIMLKVTHNGYQWQSLEIGDEYELQKIKEALETLTSDSFVIREVNDDK